MDCNAIGEIIGDESSPVQPQNTLRLKVSYKKLRLELFPTESDISKWLPQSNIQCWLGMSLSMKEALRYYITSQSQDWNWNY